MTKRVLITCPQLQDTFHRYSDMFQQREIDVQLPPVVQSLSEAELLAIIDRFDGVIAGDDEFTGPVLEKAQRLKILSKWGVGIDGIDLDAANRLGIPVTNTPHVFDDEVADVVMGYLILLTRQLHKLDQSVSTGNWKKIQGSSLRGKTLGVIGVGGIGQAVVRRAVVMGMAVLGEDIVPAPDSFVIKTGLRMVTRDELIQESDFISLNCNLTAANRHLLGSRELNLMKNGVYVINTARGALIDEDALSQALLEGKVAGAALDVFESEPLPSRSPLRKFDNCIFGTHNSSNTVEAVLRVNEMAIQNLLDGLENTAATRERD